MVDCERYVGTGRAKCIHCQKKIPKDTIGLRILSNGNYPRVICFKCVLEIVKKDFLDCAVALTNEAEVVAQ